MSRPRPVATDPEAEQEVDLRTLGERLAARWWLPVLGLVLGAIVGVLVSVGSGQTWKASTLLYLGQPFTVQGGGQIQSLATNPRTVSDIIHSGYAQRRAATASGLRRDQLRGNVTSKALTSAGQARNQTPLVEITVNAPVRTKAEKASDELAQSVIDQVSTYVDRKIDLLERQIKSSQDELADIDRRVTDAQDQLQSIVGSKSLSATEKLIATTSLNSTIGFNEQRRGTVQQELFQNQQLLSLAQNVEKSHVVQPAAATRVTATSRRNSAIVGALIGLILGCIAAYVADPLLARRNTAQEHR